MITGKKIRYQSIISFAAANIFFCLIGFSSLLYGQKQILPVVPQPKECQFTATKFLLNTKAIDLKQYCNKYEQIYNATNDLLIKIKKSIGISINKYVISDKHILIGIPDENEVFKSVCLRNNLLPSKELGGEGYNLLITSDSIIISANNQKGLFYGIQTLKQIIRGYKNKSYLPGVRITDFPSYKFRAVMDDISRGPIPTMEFMKYQVRRLSEMKINMLTYYIENVVKTKSHPEFAPAGSLTIEQLKDLSQYAAGYNITLLGNFQSFGHFNNILNTPGYSNLGESGTLISPVNPESYKFLSDIYSEMIPAFTAPFFNIDCDETFDLGKGASKELVDSIGYAEVYYNHIMKLHNILAKLNTKVFMWGDIILEYPELLKKLPKDIIIGTWTYDNLDSYSKFIDPIKNAGFDFFVTPGVLNSNKLFPDYKQTFGNIKGFALAGDKSGALGLLNTVWDDGGNAFFSNDWYGVSYAADKSWNPQSGDSSDFDYRFNAGIYGSTDNSFTQAVWKINELAGLEPTDGMNDKILFQNILPDSGKSLVVSNLEWDKVLNIAEQASIILNKTHLGYYSWDKDYLKFICDLYSSLALERSDLIKASAYYSYADSAYSSEPFPAREVLLKTIRILQNISRRESLLRSNYEKLWLNENHPYALNNIVHNYNNKIALFDNAAKRVHESLNRLKRNLPMLSKEDVSLVVSLLPGKYFREWLMVNPIPNMDKLPVSDIDYLTSMGGEATAVPKVTREFFYDSVKYRWSRVASKYEDVVNLNEIFPDNKKLLVSYAFANIESSKDTSVNALIGFNEGIKIFINGNKVFEKKAGEGFKRDEYSFLLPLHKGTNNLMLKISQTDGNWKFTFRIPDCEVRSRKNHYTITGY